MWMRKDATAGYYFVTHNGTRKLSHIASNPNISVLVGRTDFQAKSFVRVSAIAKVVEDQAVKARLWREEYKQVLYFVHSSS